MYKTRPKNTKQIKIIVIIFYQKTLIIFYQKTLISENSKILSLFLNTYVWHAFFSVSKTVIINLDGSRPASLHTDLYCVIVSSIFDILWKCQKKKLKSQNISWTYSTQKKYRGCRMAEIRGDVDWCQGLEWTLMNETKSHYIGNAPLICWESTRKYRIVTVKKSEIILHHLQCLWKMQDTAFCVPMSAKIIS